MSARPHPIDRREALRRAALLLGGAIAAPTLAGLLAGCETPAAGEGGWKPLALTGDQGALVTAISAQIIPETDTPGARGAGVHRFIDRMFAEYYAPDERAAFFAGLADVDARAHSARGKSFVQLSSADQRDILTALDADAYRAAPRDDSVRTRLQPTQPPFFRTMKELTLLGYYTSEVGATRELKYAPVPGRFDGCVPLATVGRAWSV